MSRGYRTVGGIAREGGATAAYIVVGGVAVTYHHRRVRETTAMFRTLARRHGGRVIDGRLLGWPWLEVQHDGRSLALCPVSGGENTPDRTAWRSTPARLRARA